MALLLLNQSPLLGFHFSSVQCPMIQGQGTGGPRGKSPPRPGRPHGLGWPLSLSGVLLPLRCTQPQGGTGAAAAASGAPVGSGGVQRLAVPAPPHPPAARASRTRESPRTQPGQGPEHPDARRLAPETRRSASSARLRCPPPPPPPHPARCGQSFRTLT